MSESGKGGETVRSNDKQKMIKKLKEVEMYEENMPGHEIEKIFKAVQESENMSSPGGQNKNVKKNPEPTRQDNQPCHSRGFTSKVSDRGSMSPELSTNQFRKSLSQEKRGESSDEALFSPNSRNSYGKENKDIQQTNINKTRLSINENSCEAIDNKQSTQRTNSQMRNHETSKWRINPLDALVNANDVPLQPNRKLPEKDCSEVGTPSNLDKAIAHLSNHLQRVVDLWHSQHGSSVRSQYPWGKVIQVGTDNGSWDKESIADDTSKNAGSSEANVPIDAERRRRTCTKKIIDYTAGDASESNSDDDFQKASCSKTRNPTTQAGSLENTCLLKGTVTSETTRGRKSIFNRDDIYEWGSLNEEENSDEELQKIAKKKKPTKRAGLSEKTNSPKETANSDKTRRRKNVTNQDDIYEMEAKNKQESSDEELQKGAKRMKATKSLAAINKVTNTKTNRQKSVELVSSDVNSKQNDTPMCIDDSDEIVISDNEESSQILQKPQISRSEEAVSSTSSSYPRRVIPPNPKSKYAGIRARKPLFHYKNQTQVKKQSEQEKEDDEEVARTNRKIRGNYGLQNSEIVAQLKNMDEQEVIPTQADLVEIRPLRISGRLKQQLEHLQTLRKEEEQSDLQRAEEERIKEVQLLREKEKRIKQRLWEQNEKVRREEEAAKAKAAAETRWNILMKQQEKKLQVERTELKPEGPRQNDDLSTVEVARNNRFETDENDVEVLNDKRSGGKQYSRCVPCPICNKKFPAEQIEDHAASCEEYDATSSAGASRSNSPAVSTRSKTPLFECMVCYTFSSNDGRKYEDHVNKCVSNHRDGVAVGTSTIVEVPDSPIRTLRRASEQTDSEINYKEQFLPKTRSLVNENRKRKRF